MSGTVSTGMGHHLQAGKPSQYVTSHPGQLNCLPTAGWEVSNGQSMMMLCGWVVKAA